MATDTAGNDCSIRLAPDTMDKVTEPPEDSASLAIRRSIKAKLKLIVSENKILVKTINGYIKEADKVYRETESNPKPTSKQFMETMAKMERAYSACVKLIMLVPDLFDPNPDEKDASMIQESKSNEESSQSSNESQSSSEDSVEDRAAIPDRETRRMLTKVERSLGHSAPKRKTKKRDVFKAKAKDEAYKRRYLRRKPGTTSEDGQTQDSEGTIELQRFLYGLDNQATQGFQNPRIVFSNERKLYPREVNLGGKDPLLQPDTGKDVGRVERTATGKSGKLKNIREVEVEEDLAEKHPGTENDREDIDAYVDTKQQEKQQIVKTTNLDGLSSPSDVNTRDQRQPVEASTTRPRTSTTEADTMLRDLISAKLDLLQEMVKRQTKKDDAVVEETMRLIEKLEQRIISNRGNIILEDVRNTNDFTESKGNLQSGQIVSTQPKPEDLRNIPKILSQRKSAACLGSQTKPKQPKIGNTGGLAEDFEEEQVPNGKEFKPTAFKELNVIIEANGRRRVTIAATNDTISVNPEDADINHPARNDRSPSVEVSEDSFVEVFLPEKQSLRKAAGPARSPLKKCLVSSSKETATFKKKKQVRSKSLNSISKQPKADTVRQKKNDVALGASPKIITSLKKSMKFRSRQPETQKIEKQGSKVSETTPSDLPSTSSTQPPLRLVQCEKSYSDTDVVAHVRSVLDCTLSESSTKNIHLEKITLGDFVRRLSACIARSKSDVTATKAKLEASPTYVIYKIHSKLSNTISEDPEFLASKHISTSFGRMSANSSARERTRKVAGEDLTVPQLFLPLTSNFRFIPRRNLTCLTKVREGNRSSKKLSPCKSDCMIICQSSVFDDLVDSRPVSKVDKVPSNDMDHQQKCSVDQLNVQHGVYQNQIETSYPNQCHFCNCQCQTLPFAFIQPYIANVTGYGTPAEIPSCVSYPQQRVSIPWQLSSEHGRFVEWCPNPSRQGQHCERKSQLQHNIAYRPVFCSHKINQNARHSESAFEIQAPRQSQQAAFPPGQHPHPRQSCSFYEAGSDHHPYAGWHSGELYDGGCRCMCNCHQPPPYPKCEGNRENSVPPWPVMKKKLGFKQGQEACKRSRSTQHHQCPSMGKQNGMILETHTEEDDPHPHLCQCVVFHGSSHYPSQQHHCNLQKPLLSDKADFSIFSNASDSLTSDFNNTDKPEHDTKEAGAQGVALKRPHPNITHWKKHNGTVKASLASLDAQTDDAGMTRNEHQPACDDLIMQQVYRKHPTTAKKQDFPVPHKKRQATKDIKENILDSSGMVAKQDPLSQLLAPASQSRPCKDVEAFDKSDAQDVSTNSASVDSRLVKAKSVPNEKKVQGRLETAVVAKPEGLTVPTAEQRTICLTNLPRDIKEMRLLELLRLYGNLTKIYFIKHKITGSFQGVAYVKFSRQTEAEAAVRALNGMLLDQYEVEAKVYTKSKGHEKQRVSVP